MRAVLRRAVGFAAAGVAGPDRAARGGGRDEHADRRRGRGVVADGRACGGAVSPSGAWLGSPTRRARVVRARSTMTRFSACWPRRSSRRRTAARIGACAGWPPRRGSRRRRCTGSGASTSSSRTRSARSSSPSDPQLAEKVVDVVGLYLDSARRARWCSASTRRRRSRRSIAPRPTLPMKPGKAARMTHDYKRNGTTSLYAALEIATGEVTGACYPQHRHQEFLAFLNQLVRAYPRRPLHVVLDNSSTHSTPEVDALARTPQARPLPLHPDQRLLDEHGRDLVLDPDQPTGPPRRLPRRPRTDRRDRDTSSRATTSAPSHSSGPRPPNRSSPRPPNNNPLQERCTSTPAGRPTWGKVGGRSLSAGSPARRARGRRRDVPRPRADAGRAETATRRSRRARR